MDKDGPLLRRALDVVRGLGVVAHDGCDDVGQIIEVRVEGEGPLGSGGTRVVPRIEEAEDAVTAVVFTGQAAAEHGFEGHELDGASIVEGAEASGGEVGGQGGG